MIVHLSTDDVLRLEEKDDFRRFKLVAAAGAGMAGEAAGGAVLFEDVKTAWISAQAVIEASGRADDPDWTASFRAMMEKARPHGWISADGTRIKAHVELES